MFRRCITFSATMHVTSNSILKVIVFIKCLSSHTESPWWADEELVPEYKQTQDLNHQEILQKNKQTNKTYKYIGLLIELIHIRHLATAKSLQSCPTLCNPIDGSPPGSPVPGILQARTLEWVAISFCNAWEWKVKVKSLSRARLLATPWTAAHQAPPSMGFSRQEY